MTLAYLAFLLHDFVGEFAAEDVRYNPLLDELGTGLLHPTAGKVMDAVGVLGEFEHSRARQRAEVIHREDMHVVLIHLVLAVYDETPGNHDVRNRNGVGG